VRRAPREQTTAEGSTGVSGFHALNAKVNPTDSPFQEQEPSSASVRRSLADIEAQQRDERLRVELEVAQAELLRKERELAALRSQLEHTREENDLLRHSLRVGPPSGPISVAPRVAPEADTIQLLVPDPTPVVVDQPTPVVVAQPTPVVVAQPTPVVVAQPTPVVAPEVTPLVAAVPTPSAVPSVRAPEPEALARAASAALEDSFQIATEDSFRIAPEKPFRIDPEWQEAYPVLRNVVVSSGSSASERRGEPRHSCDIEVEFADETHFFAGLTQDISRGGLFVSTYHLLPVGSQLNLRFELPNGAQIEVLGQVRWVLDPDSDARPGIGIEFVDPSPEVVASIAAFCATRPPLYFDTVVPPCVR